MTWYAVLKLLHVLAAVVWVGGGAMLTMVTSRLVRASDRAALGTVLPQLTRQLAATGGPAAGTVLVTGMAMVLVGGIAFDTLWVRLGFGGILLHFLFGAAVLRRQMTGLMTALASPTADDATVLRAGRQLRVSLLGYLALMTSIIAVMVLKPH